MKDILIISAEDLDHLYDDDHELSDAEQLLGHRCDEIDIKKKNSLMRECISELKSTIQANDLVALSAPQIGYNCRIFCVRFEKAIKTFINPIFTDIKGLELSRETDISMANKTREYIRVRHNNVTVTYLTPTGKIESAKLIGASATLIQREIDYLDGLLLCDVGLRVDKDFDEATEEERQEVITAYLDSLDIASKKLDEMIHEDPELKDVANAIDFITSVDKGETVLSDEEITAKRTDKLEDE